MKNVFILVLTLFTACTPGEKLTGKKIILNTGKETDGIIAELEFLSGKSFNHPSFAIWIEDLEGNFIETLFVTQYVGKGEFGHGETGPGKWKNEPGFARRPASLPYWAHKRGIQAEDGLYIPSPKTAVPDGLTGATPKSDFLLNAALKSNPAGKFRVLMEINQPWDSNEFWDNTKFPGDTDYFTSLQPAIIYAVTVDPFDKEAEYFLNPIGHSHPAGENGKLFTNLTTLTTAKEIAAKIRLTLKNKS